MDTDAPKYACVKLLLCINSCTDFIKESINYTKGEAPWSSGER